MKEILSSFKKTLFALDVIIYQMKCKHFSFGKYDAFLSQENKEIHEDYKQKVI